MRRMEPVENLENLYDAISEFDMKWSCNSSSDALDEAILDVDVSKEGAVIVHHSPPSDQKPFILQRRAGGGLT